MKLDLTEILLYSGKHLSYDVDEPPIVNEDLECATPIQGTIAFTNIADVLLMDGSATTSVTLECGRCLNWYDEPITIAISEQFSIQLQMGNLRARQASATVEEEESAGAGKLFSGPLFDLSEFLRQNITLELPMRPICSDDCMGLCVQCGHDMNKGPCQCKPDNSNPAFAKLSQLLNKHGQSD